MGRQDGPTCREAILLRSGENVARQEMVVNRIVKVCKARGKMIVLKEERLAVGKEIPGMVHYSVRRLRRLRSLAGSTP